MSRRRNWLAIAVTLLGVTAVYWPPTLAPGEMQIASDFTSLHQRRMAFARDALLGPSHTLPAWYPRELLGTPFWANVQNFPFLPTRLAILLAFDPFDRFTYAIAILLAANLSALFAFLFLRRVHVGYLGSVVGAWTFACSGYFASRILPGHLPLLEVYFALPMLLWLVESLHQARRDRRPQRCWALVLGLASGCVMHAGHPQLAVYSIASAIAYAIWRGIVANRRARRISDALVPLLAIALGIGCASFALLPMSLLVGRSTRVLPLSQATNDVAFLYQLIPTWWFPWFNGAPPGAGPSKDDAPFRLPNDAFFWDAVAYIGWAPWVALIVLLAIAIARRQKPGAVGIFILLLGVAGFLFALPFWQSFRDVLPGVFLRSPARLIYLTEFALAFALAVAIDALVRFARRQPIMLAVIGVGIAAHAIDLATFNRLFIKSTPAHPGIPQQEWTDVVTRVGDARIGMDRIIAIRENRALDDVGFFDSIMLARPYRFIMNLSGADPRANVQDLSAVQLPDRALAAAGVKYVVTTRARDATPVGRLGEYAVYEVPGPVPRAEFFDDANSTTRVNVKVSYARPNTDTIECTIDAPRPGFLRVIESFDLGWSATLDGQPTEIFPANDALLAVRVAPGQHTVRFTYRTPGARVGAAISLISLVLLVALTQWNRRSVNVSLDRTPSC